MKVRKAKYRIRLLEKTALITTERSPYVAIENSRCLSRCCNVCHILSSEEEYPNDLQH